MWFEALINREPGEAYCSFSEICAQLKAEYGAEDLEESRIPSLTMHRDNAAGAAEDKALPPEPLRIRGLSLPITEQTLCYTRGDFTPDRSGLLYLAYEERTGWWSSNSNQLYLEVMLARGLTRQDIAQSTERFRGFQKWGAYYWQTYGGNSVLKNILPNRKKAEP